MMTGVPSGSAPAATARTAPSWPVSGSPTGVPSASRHTRTVPSSPPLMMTGVPSGSAPAATAYTQPSWPVSGSPTGVPSASPPHPHRAVAAAADDDRGAVRQRPGRHRVHRAVVAGQRLADRGAVGQSATPAPCRRRRR